MKKGQGIIEIIIIILLILFGSFFALPSLFDTLGNILKNSSPIASSDSKSSLPSNIEAAMEIINNYKPGDIANRVETTGAIGDLIKEYKSGDESLKDKIFAALQLLAEPDLNNEELTNCLNSPSSCKTLMTITNMDWNWDSTALSTSVLNMKCLISGSGDYKDPLPIKMTYTTSYIDDNGNLITNGTVSSTVWIQKEQYRGQGMEEGTSWTYYNKTIQEFLNVYMPTTFAESKFIGEVSTVENQLNSYTTGTNNVLSSSKSINPVFDFSN